MKQLRTAVVGVGYLGRFHAQKHKLLSGSNFVGVCDASEARAREVANELSAQVFLVPSDLIGKVDAVTIAADTRSHFLLAKMFLENGVHVLVEKPITTTTAEAEMLIELAEQKSLVLQVGHIERFNPVYLAAKEHFKKPLYIETHRLAPYKPRSLTVDVVLDLMIHDIDLALSLDESTVEDITAVGRPIVTALPDIAHAEIKFESGFIANLNVSRVASGGQRQFTLLQENEVITADLGGSSFTLAKKNKGISDNPLDVAVVQVEKTDALLAETKSFFDTCSGLRKVEVSGRDGLEALRLAERITEDILR